VQLIAMRGQDAQLMSLAGQLERLNT